MLKTSCVSYPALDGKMDLIRKIINLTDCGVGNLEICDFTVYNVIGNCDYIEEPAGDL